MLTLVPLVLGPQAPDPLVALRAALAGPKTIEARVRAGGASGTLTVAADGAVRAVASGERLIHARNGDWEFDDVARVYDRLPLAGPFLGGRVGTTRLLENTPSLLVPLLTRRGRAWLDRPFRRTGGAAGASYVADFAGAELTLVFSNDRTLAAVRLMTPVGPEEWALSGFRVLPPNPALFAASVPLGYSEAFEPDVPASLRIGSELPARFKSLAPQGAKAWVLAVLEPGSEPSEAARGWLGRLGAKIPVAVRDDLTAGDRRELAAPDSPTYVLVAEGKVLGVWAGYTPSEETRMEEEMTAAIEEAGTTT